MKGKNNREGKKKGGEEKERALSSADSLPKCLLAVAIAGPGESQAAWNWAGFTN